MTVASLAVWMAYGSAGRGGWFWPLIPMLWIALLWGLVIVFGRRFWWRREHEFPGRGSGEAVLAERYARGEITEDDYGNASPCCASDPGRTTETGAPATSRRSAPQSIQPGRTSPDS